MLKIYLIILTTLIFTYSSYAQEILIKKDSVQTELFLKIPPKMISKVTRNNTSITVTLTQRLKTPFNNKIDDRFITAVNGTEFQITVTFDKDTNFSAFNDTEGLRFVATGEKVIKDMLLSYELGSPTLRRDDLHVEDAVADALFREVARLESEGLYYDALNKLITFQPNPLNSFYQQEVLFRRGNLYLQLGKTDINMFSEASAVFEQFLSLYPDSYRRPAVMKLNAIALEQSDMHSEAVDMHRQIFETAPDVADRRQALMEMARIYEDMGQYDRAISTLELYLSTFRTDHAEIYAALGKLYLARNMKDKAFDAFERAPASALVGLSSDSLLSYAKALEERKQFAKAIEILEMIAESGDMYAPEALYRIAKIKHATGDEEGSQAAVERLKEGFPRTEFGMRALVEFAEDNLASKNALAWEDFFEPILSSDDLYGMQEPARFLLIKSLANEKDLERLIDAVDKFTDEYPTSKHIDEVKRFNEKAIFDLGVQHFDAGELNEAEPLFNRFVEEFPASKNVEKAKQYIDDIKYIRAKGLYDNNQFAFAISAVEQRMVEPPQPLAQRWMDLLEDARFAKIKEVQATGNASATRLEARQYLSQLPRGRFVEEVREILVTNFLTPYMQAFKDGKYSVVISLYDENKSWLDNWYDQTFANEMKVYAALSLLNLGFRDKANELYKTIIPISSKSYAELGISLCDKSVFFDINKFTSDEFIQLFARVEQCNSLDYQLALLGKFTNDPKVALKLKYGLAKNIADDVKRESLIIDIYDRLLASDAAKFEGHEEVFLDLGIMQFKKNDYRGALIPLKKFTDLYQTNDEKRAEGLYYMGKSLLLMNDPERAFGYYRQLIEQIPTSIYAGIAKNEMEDDAWKKSMNNP